MKQDIIHYTNEAIPFNKLGGLADFVKGMTEVQKRESNIHVFLTSCEEKHLKEFEKQKMVSFTIGFFEFEVELFQSIIEGINYYFVKLPYESSKIQVYLSVIDDKYLYLFLKAHVYNETLKEMNLNSPLIFCHEWTSSFLFLFKESLRANMIYMVHNFHYQGDVDPSAFKDLPLEYRNNFINIYNKYGFFTLSHFAIEKADMVITVSDNYSKELISRNTIHSCDEVFSINKDKVFGITNPIEPNYLHDENLNNINTLKNKKVEKKKEILEKYQLNQEKLIVFISRPSEQKGIHLFLNNDSDNFYGEIKKMGYGIIFLTDASEDVLNNKIKIKFQNIINKYTHIKLIQNYSDELAHDLFLAADIHLMPSMYEPCGLSQQYAMKNGALSIVNPTGGLSETVICEMKNRGQGNGLWMQEYDIESILNCLKDADYILSADRIYNDVLKRMLKTPKYWEETIKLYNTQVKNFFES